MAHKGLRVRSTCSEDAYTEQVHYQPNLMNQAIDTCVFSQAKQRIREVAASGILLGYGRIAQLAEQLELVGQGQSVAFYDESLPAEIADMHKAIAVQQIPQVQALCDELGYSVTIAVAEELCASANASA